MSRKSAMDAAFAVAAPALPEDLLEASNRSGVPIPANSLEASNDQILAAAPRVRSGVIAAMGASLERLASRAEAAESIEAGSTVVEIDAALIDGSFVADRVSDETDPSIAALADSIRESGQQVPILVRPHPKAPGRYQMAYGHRRLRAAAQLGVPVRAIVRPLTDTELVVAQGKENLDRRDLSYIERAFFAFRLEVLAFPRDVICAAMGVHKPDVSNFITVARTIPEDVVAAIGPAPKAGGPRWRLLAERIKSASRERIEAVLGDPAFRAKPTDERFVVALEAFALEALVSAGRRRPDAPRIWTDAQGRKLARIEQTGGRFTLSIDEKLEPDFGDYLLSRLPEILAEHRARQR